MTVEEVAYELGISRFSAYREVKDGNLPHIRSGKRILIPRVAFDNWLATCGGKIPAAVELR
jgi:excisionase family DNA binding protein